MSGGLPHDQQKHLPVHHEEQEGVHARSSKSTRGRTSVFGRRSGRGRAGVDGGTGLSSDYNFPPPRANDRPDFAAMVDSEMLFPEWIVNWETDLFLKETEDGIALLWHSHLFVTTSTLCAIVTVRLSEN